MEPSAESARAAALDEALVAIVSTPRAVYGDVAPVDSQWEIGDDPERPGWTVMQQIAWALRKGSEHERTLGEYAHVAEAERKAVLASVAPLLEDIDKWFSDRASGEQRSMDWFEARLEKWAYDTRMADKETPNTVTTPSGKVSTTWSRAKIVVTDSDVFVAWLAADETDETFVEPAPSADGAVTWTAKIALKNLRASPRFAMEGDKVIDVSSGEVVPGLGVSEEEIMPKVAWN